MASENQSLRGPLPSPQQAGLDMTCPVIPLPSLMVNEYQYQPYPLPVITNDPHFIPAGGHPGSGPWHPGSVYHEGGPHVYMESGNSNQTQFAPSNGTTSPIRHVPFYCPPPAFANTSVYYGPTSGYCMPARPEETKRDPPKDLDLREMIVKQVEYYFSNNNLAKDIYLKNLMDEEGWVSIYKIAEFPRLKRMSSDIPFITEALQASNIVEIEDEKIRRRNDWSKWLLVRKSPRSSPREAENNVTSNAANNSYFRIIKDPQH